jgi:hypothetical protein
MIVRHLPSGVVKNPVTGVSGRKGMSVIQIEKVMVSDGSGFSALMLDILKERALPFEYCLTGIDSITLVIRCDLLYACKEELFEEIREKQAEREDAFAGKKGKKRGEIKPMKKKKKGFLFGRSKADDEDDFVEDEEWDESGEDDLFE